MNNVKKIVAILTVASGMIVSTVSGVVGAAVYDSHYDIDKDGYITASDAVTLGKFLCGSWAPNDISTLDVNQNGIVDWIDQNMIVAKIIGSDKVINTH